MERHPYFDLWLHSSDELTKHLGTEIVERFTLHEWPLSCVQLLRLADGKRLVYKSQLHATSVEPEFYTAARRNRDNTTNPCLALLPYAEVLGLLKNSVGMIFELIDAPRLKDLRLSPADMIDHGDRLLEAIRLFPTDLPTYIDISSQVRWSAFAEETLSMLHSLISGSQFHSTTLATVQELSTWSKSQEILSTFHTPPALNHGDLSGDNVFVAPAGYKIIDWQRPVHGPAGLDQVNYLFNMGIDPVKYTRRSLLELNGFIHLRWFVECKTRWFPKGESYDQQVADLTELILNL